jgi:hypothetical protein
MHAGKTSMLVLKPENVPEQTESELFVNGGSYV